MRLLLDTNALLWAMTNGPRIHAVYDLLLDVRNDIYVSAVSWWEIAIKSRIGKIDADVKELRIAAEQSGFQELPLLGTHAERLSSLPRYHNDPFDHMIVAQAMVEPMQLISGDKILKKYTSLVVLI